MPLNSSESEVVLKKTSQDNIESFDSMSDSLEIVEENENKEFDLTSSEDLRLFLESAENVYKEVIEFTKSERIGKFEGRDGEEVFNLLNSKITRLQELVFECEDKSLQDVEFVTNDLVAEMQSLYEDVVNLHDAIYEAYLLKKPPSNKVNKKNAVLKIKSEDENVEDDIEIKVVKLAEEKIINEQVESLIEENDSKMDFKKIRFAPTLYAQKQPGDIHPVSKTEKKDPINAIYNNGVAEVVKIKEEHSKYSFSNEYLDSSKYIDFINEFYFSPEAFEKELRLIVSEIESKTDSKLDNWLGVKFNSSFEFIQDMSVSEVLELAGGGDASTVLREKGIRYETFLTWVDLIPEMQSVVGKDESLLFGELFAKWVIESDIQEQKQEVA